MSRIAEKLIVTKWLRPAIPLESTADQFAFKQTGSTTCGILYLMHHITRMLEDNAYVRCLLVDFSKAFDVVKFLSTNLKLCNYHLLFSVELLHFYETAPRYVKSQICKVGDKLFTDSQINRGIIQGSALGPTLFTVTESDLHPKSSKNIIVKFADDTTVVLPEKKLMYLFRRNLIT